MDTTTPSGKLIFYIFASLAEFERSLISERTKAGLTAAKARGRLGGRRPGLSDDAKRLALAAETLYKAGKHSVSEMCRQLGISRPTLYNYLRHRKVEIGA